MHANVIPRISRYVGTTREAGRVDGKRVVRGVTMAGSELEGTGVPRNYNISGRTLMGFDYVGESYMLENWPI